MSLYTVWVGGSEVNGCYLNKNQASEIAEEWESRGYDDVVIEEVEL